MNNPAILVAIVLAVAVLPFILARALRVPDLKWKMVVVFYLALLALPLLRLPDSMKLGIDLSGGTILVYEIDAQKRQEQQEISDRELMEKMIAAIVRRINPAGVEDVTVRPVGMDRLEVIIPGSDTAEVERYKGLITNLGNLEFRILANRNKPELRRWIELTEPGGEYPFPQDVLRDNEVVAQWIPVSRDEAIKKNIRPWALEVLSRVGNRPDLAEAELGPDDLRRIALSELVGAGETTDAIWNELVEAGAGRDLRLDLPSTQDRLRLTSVLDLVLYAEIAATISLHGEIAWNIDAKNDRIMVLVVAPLPPGQDRDRRGLRFPAVTGEYLRRATSQVDENMQRAVGFVFNARGARLFADLTNAYKPGDGGFRNRLAILLNNQIQSAPNLNEAILSGSGQISGDFTEADIQDLIAVLNAGALPAALNPTPASEYQIGPLLGSDTIRKGTRAIIGAMCVVLAFMVVYYWFAGSVADVALLLNLLMTLGVMSFINANLTMPGLAGLVLSVGMSVDANVLIFERIREEQNRGATMRMAIRNGFDRATRAIVDANLTTLLTAVILYAIGTDQVKGFAVTLILGILMSMYTALYVSRLVFTLGEQKRWLRSFSAMDLIGKPSIDFIGKLKYCAAGSIALVVLGMVAFFANGVAHHLDIDFRGGTQVTLRFEQDKRSTAEQVRAGLSALPDLSVVDIQIGDSAPGLRFDVRTSNTDADAVKQAIGNAFGSDLARIEMSFERQPDETLEMETAPAQSQAEKSQPDLQEPGNEAADQPENTNAKRLHWRLGFKERVPVSVVEDLFGAEANRVGLVNADPQIRVQDNARLTTAIDLSTAEVAAEQVEQALGGVKTALASQPIFEQTLNFGGRVAHDMQIKALWAILLSLAGIVAYLWIRFQKVYFGIAAVVALVHDVFITLGMIALTYWLAPLPMIEHFKINLPMIAGFLTLIGYSLNDTIVTFDRLREVRGKSRDLTPQMVNLAVNQTLSRTLLTSLTTFIVVSILYFFGGEGVRGFAFCLLVGIITGTYSSIYIASPALLWLSKQPIFAGPEQRSVSSAR